ncbi:MAG: purine-nucleoside phosphorylase, partial [Clostridia bacterium]|nr:purine-nucleoside phosphorylase [Clostridia bacterium]
DIVIGQGACTNSNYASQFCLPGTYAPISSFKLLRQAVESAEKMGLKFMVGNLFSSDNFYDDSNSTLAWSKMGVLAVEMESAALYMNAARAGKNALCICTISDNLLGTEPNSTAEERQNSFTTMMELALDVAVNVTD